MEPFQNGQSFSTLGQSGEISPNLITLSRIYRMKFWQVFGNSGMMILQNNPVITIGPWLNYLIPTATIAATNFFTYFPFQPNGEWNLLTCPECGSYFFKAQWSDKSYTCHSVVAARPISWRVMARRRLTGASLFRPPRHLVWRHFIS